MYEIGNVELIKGKEKSEVMVLLFCPKSDLKAVEMLFASRKSDKRGRRFDFLTWVIYTSYIDNDVKLCENSGIASAHDLSTGEFRCLL